MQSISHDETTPELVGLTEAARIVNRAHPPHPATLTRWIKKGIQNPDGTRTHLMAVRRGGSWATTPDALHDFLLALTRAHLAGDGASSPTPALQAPNRAHEAAERELDQMGA